jgi:hypothetical protein
MRIRPQDVIDYLAQRKVPILDDYHENLVFADFLALRYQGLDL